MTARLVLEPLRVEHAVEMVAVLSSPALYAVIGGEPPSLAELTARYARQTAGPGVPQSTEPNESTEALERWCNWVLREGEELVGYVQATVTLAGQPAAGLAGRSAAAALAWLVRPQDQGRGLAVEAAVAMAVHLRETGVGPLTAWIADHHPASQAVARRLGLLPTEQVDGDGERCWVSFAAG